MDFIKCFDKKTKDKLINQGFKLLGTELINNKNMYIFSTKSMNLNKNKNLFSSDKLYF